MKNDGISRLALDADVVHAPGTAQPAFILRNARAVTPGCIRAGSILVEGGLIREIAEDIRAPVHTIDCAGDLVLPGLIELHTDNFERHLEPRPGTFWDPARAILSHDAEMASAGITTAFDAVTLGNDIHQGYAQQRYIEFIEATASARAEGLLRIEHELHLRCEVSSSRMREDLELAMSHRLPRLVSLMDHTPGQGQWTDIERFREHYVRRYGLPMHQVDALIHLRQQSRERFAPSNRSAVLNVAHLHFCTLASHDDTTVSDIEQAHADACQIAEFPTSLEAARLARDRGMYVVAGAPNLIRGGSHSGNVDVAALVREGLCDILSSDYYPSSLVQAVFELARNCGLSLPAAVATASYTPARALGLSDRGEIHKGKRADLIRVREVRSGPIVVSTWCAGRQVA